jgi:hypothetical protein
MKHHVIRASILASLLVATPAHAEASAKVFLENIDGQNQDLSLMFALNLGSILIGIQTTQAYIQVNGGKIIYCSPRKMVITTEQTASILREFVKKEPKLAEESASWVLLYALRETFPCEPTAR